MFDACRGLDIPTREDGRRIDNITALSPRARILLIL